MKVSLRLKILLPSLLVLFSGLIGVSVLAHMTAEKILVKGMVDTSQFSLENLQKLLGKVDLQELIENYKVDDYDGFTFIVDSKGVCVKHPDRNFIGVNIRDYDWGLALLESSGGFTYSEIDGMSKLLSQRRIGDLVFCTSVFTAPYLVPLEILDNSLKISAIVIALILSLIIVFSLTHTTIRPLRDLQGKILVLAGGEGDLTKKVEAERQDEVGDLALGINAFVASLCQIIGNIKIASAETQVIKGNLCQNAEDTSTAVRQITGNVGEISKGIAVLDERIINSSATVKQIEENIAQLNQQIENQGSAVEQSTASVNEMVSSLKNVVSITQIKEEATVQLVETTRRGGEKVNQMNRVVTNIHNSVDQISEMVTIIDDIASLTNMLSMNAAIEAAHAGNAGHGFAVVSGEIRKLAKSTEDNSRAINDVLLKISSLAEEADDAVRETDSAFVEINREVLSVSHALSEINSSTQELSVGSEQIHEAMMLLQEVSSLVREGSEEMERGASGMRIEMQNVQEISKDVRGRVGEIAEGSGLIAHSTEAMNRLADELSDNARGLDREINRFKTE